MHRAVNRSSVALQELPTRNEYSTRQRYDVDDPYSFSLQAPTSSPAVVRFGPVLSFFLSLRTQGKDAREEGSEPCRPLVYPVSLCPPTTNDDKKEHKKCSSTWIGHSVLRVHIHSIVCRTKKDRF